MVNGIKDVCIIGGGTAGWLCAAYLKKHTNTNVKLIESDKVPTIGVGESVPPHFVEFLKRIDIDLFDFMRETGAVLKYSNYFKDWSDIGKDYHFTFTQPGTINSFKNSATQTIQDSFDLTDFNSSTNTCDYFTEFCNQGVYAPEDFLSKSSEAYHYCLHNKSTFFKQTKDLWKNVLPNLSTMALHIDANKTGPYLSNKIKIEEHCNNYITDIVHKDNAIQQVITDDGKIHTADLFIDCSGFSRLLIDKVGQWKNTELAPCNKAWVAPYKYKNPTDQCKNHTQSIARTNGWTFQVTLHDRAGCGYVFCDKFITKEQAREEFLSYMPNEDFLIPEPRYLEWTSGYYKEALVNNVCAVGLSSGFIEPLEANGLFFVTSAVVNLAKYVNKEISKQDFNDVYEFASHDNYEFIHTHYNLTNREDTDFWRWQKQQGVEHNTKEIVYSRYKNSKNTYRGALEGYTEFPEYMWYKLAIYFGLDINKMSNEINKALMNIAFLHFETVHARGEYGASIAKDYRSWLEDINKEKGQ